MSNKQGTLARQLNLHTHGRAPQPPREERRAEPIPQGRKTPTRILPPRMDTFVGTEDPRLKPRVATAFTRQAILPDEPYRRKGGSFEPEGSVGSVGSTRDLRPHLTKQMEPNGRLGPICTMRCSGNNTMITVAGPNRPTRRRTAGRNKLRGARRGTAFVAETRGRQRADRCVHAGMTELAVVGRGWSEAMGAVVRRFVRRRILMTVFARDSAMPHGGTRLRKARRI